MLPILPSSISATPPVKFSEATSLPVADKSSVAELFKLLDTPESELLRLFYTAGFLSEEMRLNDNSIPPKLTAEESQQLYDKLHDPEVEISLAQLLEQFTLYKGAFSLGNFLIVGSSVPLLLLYEFPEYLERYFAHLGAQKIFQENKNLIAEILKFYFFKSHDFDIRIGLKNLKFSKGLISNKKELESFVADLFKSSIKSEHPEFSSLFSNLDKKKEINLKSHVHTGINHFCVAVWGEVFELIFCEALATPCILSNDGLSIPIRGLIKSPKKAHVEIHPFKEWNSQPLVDHLFGHANAKDLQGLTDGLGWFRLMSLFLKGKTSATKGCEADLYTILSKTQSKSPTEQCKDWLQKKEREHPLQQPLFLFNCYMSAMKFKCDLINFRALFKELNPPASENSLSSLIAKTLIEADVPLDLFMPTAKFCFLSPTLQKNIGQLLYSLSPIMNLKGQLLG